jgi:Protein of unknown function (DUF1524)
MDTFLKDQPRPQYVPSEDTTAVNLEHVLPINPSADWNLSADVAAAYYRQLGNLVLLSSRDNVAVANKTFTEKKPVVAASPFNLTKEIATYDQWGPVAIDGQQQRMAALAAKVWPI